MSIPVGCSINIMSSVAVASTGVVYGNSADLRMFRGFSLRIQATSATGTPDLQVEWEASNVRPSTEAAVDTNYVIPDEMNTSMDPIYPNLNDQLWHMKQLLPPPSNFARLRITGVNSNPADTLVTAELWLQG